jgi:serine phosphatase RsbU (regulator of sigma subunit)
MDEHAHASIEPGEDTSCLDSAVLIRTGRVLNSTLNLPDLHDAVLRLLAEVCHAEAAVLLLVERKSQNFVMMRVLNRRTDTFTDCTERDANRLFSWVQSENPAGQPPAAPLPRRVEALLDDYVDPADRKSLWSVLNRRGRLSGAIGIVYRGDDRPERGVFLSAVSNQIATALDNALLFRAVKRRSLEARILLQSSVALSRGLELDEILNTILDKLQTVIPYDAAGIFLFRQENGELTPIIDRGFDEDKHSNLSRKSDEGLVGYAVRTGEIVLVDDVRTDPRYTNARDATRSELVIPIRAAGRLVGAFDLERDITSGFNTEALDLASAFAGSAGLAIERAQLYREALAKRRLDGELEIARSIQETFLPKANPVIPGYDIAGLNFPSEEVGGDYYDFIPIVNNQLGIAIGDVSGKGIPAALIMAAFRASLIAEIRNNYAIRTIFAKVNSLLEETSERGRFVTAMYGVLDTKNGILTFANAGHNPGLLLRGDDSIEYLAEGGLPFAIKAGVTYEERPVSIRPGDVMLWYTDGVTDAINQHDEFFEEERLIRILRDNRHLPAVEILNTINREIRAFAAPDSKMDDITMIIVRALPLTVPRPGTAPT